MENKEPTILIRIAEKKDAEIIADISRRTFFDSFAAQNTRENMDIFLNVQFPRERQMAEVGSAGRTFLLAYWGEELVGFASLRETTPPSGLEDARAIEIVQIYSEHHAIGKGVGKALMQACLDTARTKGKEWVWLGVWEKNQRAITFYTKWGFEHFGEHIFLVGHDPQTDWWMKRKV
ncbi:N-acetyltransferase family protein [Flavitalea flava]